MGLKASKLIKGGCTNRIRAKKGYVPVCVGCGSDSKRFMIKASSLSDADVLEYLEESKREYGFSNVGVLKIPCDVKRFEERMVTENGSQSLRIITVGR